MKWKDEMQKALTRPENNYFTSLPPEIQLKIWKQLPLAAKNALSQAHHKKCRLSKCKAHLCPLNPIKPLIVMTTPIERPFLHCPLCGIILLFKEFGGQCPEGSNPTNPFVYPNRQPLKTQLLYESDETNEHLR